MPTSYFPQDDKGLLGWGANLNDKAGINPAAYSLTADQGAQITQAFGDFETAMARLQDPATKSPLATQQKNTSRKKFKGVAMVMVNLIQAFPTTTDDMRADLRITIRDEPPTPVPAPGDAPLVKVVSVRGRTFKLELLDARNNRRRKPSAVGAAWLYYAVGEEMPAFERMTFNGSTSTAATQMVVPLDVPVGAKVWVSACWVSTSEKCGPVSLPVFAWTNHGAVQNVA